MRKRILIVNCYFNEFRFPIRQRMKRPQSLAPSFLAGMFSARNCEIKLYDEVYSGYLEDEKLLGWPDMVVFTGLDATFDRMLHLTAYARSKNPRVIVVAGGPVIRAIPLYAKNFFDYCCTGDVEQMREVIEEALGNRYVSEIFLESGWAMPRYDLTYWMNRSLGYVESSRGCCYSCNFCSLTAENAKYLQYDIRYLEAQFKALGKRRMVLFLDNNFGSPGSDFFIKRMELLKELKRKNQFWGWNALVTNDFFLKDENLRLAREAGCATLFSGVESFDNDALVGFDKYQNTRQSARTMIRRCLESGIGFLYGMIYDLSSRTIAENRAELELMLNTPEIPLPAYFVQAVPLLGTGFFYECLEQKRLLPNVKIRDLDGTTLNLKPLDPVDEAVQFMRDIQTLAGYNGKALRHALGFFLNHRKNLDFKSMFLTLYSTMLICTPGLANAKSDLTYVVRKHMSKYKRTYLGSTESPDHVYTPAFPVDSRFEHYFKPTMLTDGNGNLAEDLQADFAVATIAPGIETAAAGMVT